MIEKIIESQEGLLDSMIGKLIIDLKVDFCSDNDLSYFKNKGKFDAYGRLILMINPEYNYEFITESYINEKGDEYNKTSIIKIDSNEAINSFKSLGMSHPFTIKRLFIYGEKYDSNIYKVKNDIGNQFSGRDTEDILIFESTKGEKLMLRTPQAPYFEIIQDETKIMDIIKNWEYPHLGKNEKMYKLRRTIE